MAEAHRPDTAEPGIIGDAFDSEQTIRSKFTPEIDFAAGFRRLGNRQKILPVSVVVDTHMSQSIIRYPLLIENQQLATEVEAAPDRLPGPFGGNGSGEVNPGAVPRLPPVLPFPDFPVFPGQAI